MAAVAGMHTFDNRTFGKVLGLQRNAVRHPLVLGQIDLLLLVVLVAGVVVLN